MPYKIRALIVSIGARNLPKTKIVTLTRVKGASERQQKAIDLIKHNTRASIKDLTIIIESIQTIDGNELELEQLPPYDASLLVT